jgi:hydroxylaminobenzene mutase
MDTIQSNRIIDIENFKKRQSDKLIFFGVLLFFLGLVVGLLIPMMANPRMGLTTHLEGVINGIFLIVLGVIWHKLELSNRWLSLAFRLTFYGAFANFFAVLIAAITGSGKMMPIAGGQEGSPLIEGIITFLLISLSIAMLAVCVIILTGLYKYINSEKKNDISQSPIRIC